VCGPRPQFCGDVFHHGVVRAVNALEAAALADDAGDGKHDVGAEFRLGNVASLADEGGFGGGRGDAGSTAEQKLGMQNAEIRRRRFMTSGVWDRGRPARPGASC